MMVESLLFPAAPLLSSWCSSSSRLPHAWREHQRWCPVCKTVCAVEPVVPIYINHHTAHHCVGKGEARMEGEDCRCRQHQDDPEPPWGCGGNRPKGATTAGRDARTSPPPTLTAATTAAAVAAGCGACCCHRWRWQKHKDNATVTMATTATTTAMMVCTVTAASTETVATAMATVMAMAMAMAKAPHRNRCHRLCQRSYLCLRALSFFVFCLF